MRRHGFRRVRLGEGRRFSRRSHGTGRLGARDVCDVPPREKKTRGKKTRGEKTPDNEDPDKWTPDT
ncbi:hypothetical protein Msi02_04090 [Microbispora siamensis]|uniref:Uncharacterized protein n=1 Tax=Microbispora siamensis TaxID=564413 RepID=A0ABQ4GDT0_9ACTN|nr:hypothetical protein Msi02_04090 [Microbispora siamensis]